MTADLCPSVVVDGLITVTLVPIHLGVTLEHWAAAALGSQVRRRVMGIVDAAPSGVVFANLWPCPGVPFESPCGMGIVDAASGGIGIANP